MAEVTPTGVGKPANRVLLYLSWNSIANAEFTSVGELARELGMTVPDVQAVLEQLKAQGKVAYEDSPGYDRTPGWHQVSD